MRAHQLLISLTTLFFASKLAAQAPVTFTINAGSKTPISPYIYGVNGTEWAQGTKRYPLARLGGNRWTAYNWENNASNAGADWFHQNDDFLGGGNTAGEAVRMRVAESRAAGAATIVTVPMVGYVAADKLGGGDVNQSQNYLSTRFRVSKPVKGAAFAYPPVTADANVYQDEFVRWLQGVFPASPVQPALWYSLDNEPDLWAETHARIHPNAVQYQEMADRTKALASAIKTQAPQALVLGPVSYGWYGYVRLQGAPDAQNRDFIDFFLAQMKAAETQAGKRLLDILDLHWYPEAKGDGVRITGEQTTPGVVAARVQAPRSLWDPTYTETSWICQDWLNAPIQLIPRMRAKIDASYPGTKLAFTEYNYGGGGHISGALAQADVLGVFGREGVFAANLWELASDQRFLYAALDCYLRYDGKNRFGDVSVGVSNSDVARTSAYASLDSRDPSRMVLVAINKTETAVPATFVLNGWSYRRTRVFRLAGSTPSVVFASSSTNAYKAGATKFTDTMPAMSVSVVELTR